MCSCPGLRYLNLAYARCIEDFKKIVVLDQLEGLVEFIHCCIIQYNFLQVLEGNRDKVSGDILLLICERMQNLRLLNLENCAALSTVSMKHLHMLTQLRSLNVSNLNNFTDVCLVRDSINLL